MKKTTIAATGTALVAGAYIVVASLFPSMIERRANSPESMKQVRAEVKQAVNDRFYSRMNGSIAHKVNGLPFETPKQVYSDVEKSNIQRGLYWLFESGLPNPIRAGKERCCSETGGVNGCC